MALQKLHCYFLLLSLIINYLPTTSHQALPLSQDKQFNQANNYDGSSEFGNLEYHMGPVLAASVINLYVIWYGHWNPTQQAIIRDFVYSISSPASYPSVADWWRTVRLYTDQTGANITGNILLSGEFHDSTYSHGRYLSRLDMQSIIKTAVDSHSARALPLDPHKGLYFVLTSHDVQVQDFCRAVCGFHYFTFPYIVGATVPYAWIGYSGTQCPGMCAYPFAWPKYSGWPQPPAVADGGGHDIMLPPNGDAGVDGMISIIAHELAEVSSNPLVNAWYGGDNPTAPNEIADMCLGVYGSGSGGGYIGKVYKDSWGIGYNVNGVKGRKFLVQWVWDPSKRRCYGPNAID